MIALIEKGSPGWKINRLKIKILEVVGRSTTPQTCWNVFQKLRKSMPVDGNDIGKRMVFLCERGYLERVGFDDDNDSQYIIKQS